VIDRGSSATPAAETISAIVARILRPPSGEDAIRQAFFAGKAPSGGFGIFRRFRTLLESGVHFGRDHGAAPAYASEHALPDANLLDDERERADRFAESYATRYRDAFVANYLLGALAVLAALIGFAWPGGTILELLFIGGILVVTRRGRAGHWHERWLGYRMYAEQIRQVELLRPLGRRSMALVPETGPGDPLWVTWLAASRAREAGMASGVIDGACLDAYRAMLDKLLHDQEAYHARASQRQHVMAHRLHAVGTALFFVTAVVCAAHLGIEIWHHVHPGAEGARSGETMNALLTLIAAVLPAFGAALAGIATQGEFERGANRSHAMHDQLQRLRSRLASAQPSSAAYAEIAEETVEVMSEELLEWQATVRTRPIALPA
jgi:hypothetical protein